jgi:tetratricopeptide (TPR) repeat protein
MCNYSSIKSLLGKRIISRANVHEKRSLVVAIYVLALLAGANMPASAQMQSPLNALRRIDEFDWITGRIPTSEEGLGYSQRAAPAAVNPVSVDELRHPLTEKAGKLLLKAWNYAVKGDHFMAISTLKDNMFKVRELTPYAHGILGIEYLRMGQSTEALPELTQAASLFPHDATVHSNLALAYCMNREYERAEQEARLALYLEPTMSSAQEIMQIISEKKAQYAKAN